VSCSGFALSVLYWGRMFGRALARCAILVIVAGLGLAGCGRRAASPPDGGRDGAGDGEGGASCAVAATGSFTFHVHNAGTSTLLVDLGCGTTLPMALDTPDGTRQAGPGNVDPCGFTCDDVYAGRAIPGGCTDCGGGIVRSIAAGATTDLRWDRRVYAEAAADPACSPRAGPCALGVAVAPAASQTGTLTTCPADQHPTLSCLQPLVTSFDVDTSGPDATINVGP